MRARLPVMNRQWSRPRTHLVWAGGGEIAGSMCHNANISRAATACLGYYTRRGETYVAAVTRTESSGRNAGGGNAYVFETASRGRGTTCV